MRGRVPGAPKADRFYEGDVPASLQRSAVVTRAATADATTAAGHVFAMPVG
jgi:hypothetical protein